MGILNLFGVNFTLKWFGVNRIIWGEWYFGESLQPSENGAPGGIRTPDQVVRSHLLYPAELRVHSGGAQFNVSETNI